MVNNPFSSTLAGANRGNARDPDNQARRPGDMRHFWTTPRLLQSIFVVAVSVAYVGVFLGLAGYVGVETATLWTLSGSAVGCAVAGLLLIATGQFRRH
jgi:hypothetical protein